MEVDRGGGERGAWNMRRYQSALVILAVAVSGAVLLGVSIRKRRSTEQALRQEEQRAMQTAGWVAAHRVVFTETTIRAGLNFSTSLQEMGLDAAEVFNIVRSARPVFDFRRVRAGNVLTVGRSTADGLREVEYQIDAEQLLRIASSRGTLRAEVASIPVTTETAGVLGRVEDSLFNAVVEAGEAPELALRLADIFGWDLDFYTDTQPGDTFRLAVEKKKYLNGRLASYGRILAAEYVNAGRPYRAVLFHDQNGKAAYYTPEGKSLQKAFLRSPLKFSAPITSRFSRSRFHPILKRYRPHLGIDYGAPTGTPVQTIAEGRVVYAGYRGEAGKTVQIRHTNGYETYYCHLSRIFVRVGQHVAQGERIGLVGATGLATGPHLDFRLRRHGTFINFATLTLPPAEPVAKTDWVEFITARDQQLPLLPSSGTLVASAPPKSDEPATLREAAGRGTRSAGR
jgi:murein DD-endopeptidase MepM/ murein hydrolase activator NlpD